MTDRELLELAAKAVGIKPDPKLYEEGIGVCWSMEDEHGVCIDCWNPLMDDGDALRLAVKLGIYYRLYDDYVSTSFGNGEVFCEEFNDDPYAATRRAIVRAAAEIGRGME